MVGRVRVAVACTPDGSCTGAAVSVYWVNGVNLCWDAPGWGDVARLERSERAISLVRARAAKECRKAGLLRNSAASTFSSDMAVPLLFSNLFFERGIPQMTFYGRFIKWKSDRDRTLRLYIRAACFNGSDQSRELARQSGVSVSGRFGGSRRRARSGERAAPGTLPRSSRTSGADHALQRPCESSGGPEAGGPACAEARARGAWGAVRETLREHGEPVSAGAMPYAARTANEVLKAQERRVACSGMKGELVDRAKAVAQFFRLARDERDAWVNWPARVAAMIAAELEVDPHQLHTVLKRHVRDQLAELAEVRPSLR